MKNSKHIILNYCHFILDKYGEIDKNHRPQMSYIELMLKYAAQQIANPPLYWV